MQFLEQSLQLFVSYNRLVRYSDQLQRQANVQFSIGFIGWLAMLLTFLQVRVQFQWFFSANNQNHHHDNIFFCYFVILFYFSCDHFLCGEIGESWATWMGWLDSCCICSLPCNRSSTTFGEFATTPSIHVFSSFHAFTVQTQSLWTRVTNAQVHFISFQVVEYLVLQNSIKFFVLNIVWMWHTSITRSTSNFSYHMEDKWKMHDWPKDQIWVDVNWSRMAELESMVV